MMDFCFDDAVFTCAISTNKMNVFSYSKYIEGCKLFLNYTSKTEIFSAEDKPRKITIVGLCIDAHGKINRKDIPQFILRQKYHRVEEMYRGFDRFAGKYIVIYSDHQNAFIWGDATCSMPLNYGYGKNEFCISSFEKMTADYFGYEVSSYYMKIRLGADIEQAMPGDTTVYKEVKALLPNHYLDVAQHRVHRVKLNVVEEKNRKKQENVIGKSISLLRNITSEYSQYYELVCPLTAGYDSRLVFAFWNEVHSGTDCFLYRKVSEKSGEIQIPKQICKDYKKHFHLINVVLPDNSFLEKVSAFLGVNMTVNISDALTFKAKYQYQARINGNIIDQIGKSLLGNAVPTFLGSPRFLQCKIHNYVFESRRELNQYVKKLKRVENKEHIFDIFAWDSRLGRWAGTEEGTLSLCGMNSLCIFNCRELILDWISVPRLVRTKNWIHVYIFKKIDSQLLTYPFNPDSKTSFLKKHWILFYIGSLSKQWIHSLHFKLKGDMV